MNKRNGSTTSGWGQPQLADADRQIQIQSTPYPPASLDAESCVRIKIFK